jgi:hypothetical protein
MFDLSVIKLHSRVPAHKRIFSEVLWVICVCRRNTEANEGTYLTGELIYIFPNWIQTTEFFEFTSAVTANCVSTKSWRRVVRGVAGNRAEHNDVTSKPTWELTAGCQLTMNKLRQLTFVPSVRSTCPRFRLSRSVTTTPLSKNFAFLFEGRSQNCEKRLLVSSCLSVRPHGTTRFPRDGFSWKLILCSFKKKQKLKFNWNVTRITGT